MTSHQHDTAHPRSAGIRDYGIIGDGRSAALISRHGAVDWLCLPDFNSPPVFAALLDPGRGGSFSIIPDEILDISRRYLPDTAVLETTFRTREGVVRLLDGMPFSAQRHEDILSPEREVLRGIECLAGNPLLRVRIDPRAGFSSKRLRFRDCRRLGWRADHHGSALYIHADIPLLAGPDGLDAELRLRPGECRWISLSFHPRSVAVIPALGEAARARLDHSGDWWRNWCGQIDYRGPYLDAVKRSAITLRLLTFPMSGALVAAATTSLPESPGGSMNWDYRYCWPRDAAWAVMGFMDIGLYEEAEAFIDWLILANKLTAPQLKVMYDVYGRADVGEREHPDWSGFRDSHPVRSGNALGKQWQLDVYGEVMMAVSQFQQNSHGKRLGTHETRMLKGFGKVICREWREPDNGIWEIRDARHHYTYSKAQAWFVLDCLLKLHERGVVRVPVEKYRRIRDQIRAVIESEGFDSQAHHYRGILGEDNVDAALLLLPALGYLSPDDPRMLGLWEKIHRDLDQGGLINRYSPGFAGQHAQEGAFMICSFWAADYLARLDRLDEAYQRFDRAMSYGNDLLLFSEEANPRSGAMLGNFPQAFSHTGLINAAVALARAERRRRGQDAA